MVQYMYEHVSQEETVGYEEFESITATLFLVSPFRSNVLYIFMVSCSSESNAEYSRRTGHEKTFPFSPNV